MQMSKFMRISADADPDAELRYTSSSFWVIFNQNDRSSTVWIKLYAMLGDGGGGGLNNEPPSIRLGNFRLFLILLSIATRSPIF